MTENYNPNKISPNDPDWIEAVSKNYDQYISDWIQQVKLGELLKEDVLRAVEKIAKYKNNKSIIAEAKRKLGFFK